MSWWSSLVQGIEGITLAAGGQPAEANTNLQEAAGQAVTGGGIIPLVEGIYAGVTDGKLWRSLGWLLLGVVLILLGAVMIFYTQTPVGRALRQASA